ncbi:MAG: Replicative DNA helicase [candidate division CPR2 bacterium GW2011_GWC1_39_9]|uniref:Replicative DNA helicase n=1 Tax=candidate division CPR2 bacterium GW2011_GWC2_39_10 TaxID=1618345 RepID=A0A0G0LV11_UNCC2|nr:MAG: Replicative DNA helicase [candidate division CPR2 bacterium GW2011_GWC2_39_10]KKR33913.1 MAG: Replicative DNA helicase [candidate division CPR2 bacterium GW2011_GWC1_39_9]
MARETKKTIDPLEKIPPQNVEAEISVLGCLLLEKDALIKVVDILSPEDFYKREHEGIYEAMLELFEKRQPIDLITLSNRLDEKKTLKEIGGSSYLASLANAVVSSAHVFDYAKIVADKAVLRRLIEAANYVIETTFSSDGEIDEVLDKAEQTLFSVSQRHHKQKFISIKSILTDSFEKLDLLHKDKESLRGVPTGFKELDNKLAGLQPSDLIIIGGRPSMGKSSFALNVGQYLASKEGMPVGMFSLEMSKEQLVDRMLCSEANIDSWKLRTGNLNDDDFPKIGQAMATLSEAPLFIDDTPGITVLEMRAKARRLQAEHGLGLIIVDYLQLMSGRYSDNRVQEISEISRSLKGLARELNVPVMALSQLSRQLENRPDKRPQLSDLRESGSIEQDADVVMFVYRDDYYNKDSEKKNVAEILIRKHRNGPTGEVDLYWVAEQMAFKNLEKKRA